MKGTLGYFLVLYACVIIPVVPGVAPTLARYRLSFNTFWSEEIFPKQYPLYRPPAQWSVLIGRSHGPDFHLWRQGEQVNQKFKTFVETGKTVGLDLQLQGHDDILDSFKTKNIKEGVGATWAEFFTTANQSKVSLACRVVPSPDWFVGLDSLDLFDHDAGQWRESVTLDLPPMDAGTDKGFTFTSPNWAEVPQLPVTMITSQFPEHPANSFYYPDLRSLPVLARVRVELVRTFYQEANGLGCRGRQETESIESSEQDEEDSEEVDDSEELDMDETTEVVSEEPVTTAKPKTSPSTQGPRTTRRRPRKPKEHRRSTTVAAPSPPTTTELITTRRQTRRTTVESGPVDCIQGDWGEWSACSKTCGYGFESRVKQAFIEARNGGQPCAVETEQRLCGSMRNCGWNRRQSSFSNFDWRWDD